MRGFWIGALLLTVSCNVTAVTIFGADGPSGGRLYSIDPMTGTKTLIGNGGNPASIYALAFAPDGTLYGADGPSGGRLYSIDPTTGTKTLIGNGGNPNSIYGLAIVPLPPAVWLFTTAIGLLGLLSGTKTNHRFLSAWDTWLLGRKG